MKEMRTPLRLLSYVILLTMLVTSVSLQSNSERTPDGISSLSVQPYSFNIPHAPIHIIGDANLTGMNAVSSGSGTALNPYVIEGLYIDANGTGDCLYVQDTTSHLVIRNCWFNHTGQAGHLGGIRLQSVSNVTIENCLFSNCENGIYASSTDHLEIRNCTAQSTTRGILLDMNNDNVLIANNTISGGSYGIFVYRSSCSISGGYVTNSSWAAIYSESSDITVTGCTIVESARGIYCKLGTAELHKNLINCPNSPSVLLDVCTGATISGNNMFGTGIFLNSITDWQSIHIYENNTLNGLPVLMLSGEALGPYPAHVGQIITVGVTGGTLEGITVSGGGTGAYIENCTDLEIKGCSFSSNSLDGLYMHECTGCTVNNTILSGNGGFGLEAYLCKGLTLNGNNASNNKVSGMGLEYTISSLISYNNFSGNGAVALELGYGSSGCNVLGNNLFSTGANGTLAVDNGLNNRWNGTNAGNFWGDYITRYPNASALGKIWDTPYAVGGSSGTYDSYPLVFPVNVRNILPDGEDTDGQIEMRPRGSISIKGDREFTEANGVVAGSGTVSDPYVLRGWTIDTNNDTGILIENTTVSFSIENCTVNISSQNRYSAGIRLINVSGGVLVSCQITLPRTSEGSGIQIIDSSDIEVRNCIISGGYDSMGILNSSGILVASNNMVQTESGIVIIKSSGNFTGNTISGNGSSGVGILGLSHVSFFGNRLKNCTFSVHYSEEPGQNVRISENNTVNGAPVIFLADANMSGMKAPAGAGQMLLVNITGLSVSQLRFSNLDYGLEMQECQSITIDNSSFSECYGAGLYLYQCLDIDITHCTFKNNYFGLKMEATSGSRIEMCVFSGNTVYAVQADALSGGNTFTHNSFLHNGGGWAQAYDAMACGYYCWENWHENYWSDMGIRYPNAHMNGMLWNWRYYIAGSSLYDDAPLTDVWENITVLYAGPFVWEDGSAASGVNVILILYGLNYTDKSDDEGMCTILLPRATLSGSDTVRLVVTWNDSELENTTATVEGGAVTGYNMTLKKPLAQDGSPDSNSATNNDNGLDNTLLIGAFTLIFVTALLILLLVKRR